MPNATEEAVRHAQIRAQSFAGARPLVPARHLAVVACMDSRIDVFDLFGLRSGDAHVIRNAGGLITDDVLRSLVLSQRILQTREIILLHHTDCGLQKIREDRIRAELTAEVGEPPAYEFGAFTDVDDAVRRAVARVKAHRYLPHRERVRGFVYQVEDGHLREPG